MTIGKDFRSEIFTRESDNRITRFEEKATGRVRNGRGVNTAEAAVSAHISQIQNTAEAAVNAHIYHRFKILQKPR